MNILKFQFKKGRKRSNEVSDERIKNENDVEAALKQTMAVATTVVSDFKGLSAGMTPFVSLTRLSSPLLRGVVLRRWCALRTCTKQ